MLDLQVLENGCGKYKVFKGREGAGFNPYICWICLVAIEYLLDTIIRRSAGDKDGTRKTGIHRSIDFSPNTSPQHQDSIDRGLGMIPDLKGNATEAQQEYNDRSY